MKLWLISQVENNDYDTYDSMVVAAETQEEAQKTPPFLCPDYWDSTANRHRWATTLDKVDVEYIGEAKESTQAGIICASFNVG